MARVAIAIGHNEAAQGATAVDGVTEYVWNTPLAEQLRDELVKLGHDASVYLRASNRSYTDQMQRLTDAIDRDQADVAVELHFNSIAMKPGDPGPQRTTVLHWPGSYSGGKLARILADEIADVIGGPDRPRAARAQDKSWAGLDLLFLKLTRCPAIICEPHFGCTPADHAAATRARDSGELAVAMARGIDAFLRGRT
jgi:N-acetylmuramoyl-L-alanine amidase